MDFLKPLGGLLVNDQIVVLLAEFNFESLRLVVHHGNVNDAVCLEASNVKMNGRAITNLCSNRLKLIDHLVILILYR